MSSPLTDDTKRRPATAAAERSYPLIAIFHLASFWAATAACIDGNKLAEAVRDARQEPLQAALVAATACVVGGVIGAAIGLGQLRPWRSALLGGAGGAVYGLTVLCVYGAPAPLERGLAAAAVVTATTLAFRVRAA